MRDFKFRAWDSVNEKMEYEIALTNQGEAIRKGYHWFNVENTVLNEKVMQYTGLKDMNGKEIYEGDIVKHLGNMVGEVYYDEGETSYILKPLDKASSYEVLGLQCELEIIGNIYENPELLEVK